MLTGCGLLLRCDAAPKLARQSCKVQCSRHTGLARLCCTGDALRHAAVQGVSARCWTVVHYAASRCSRHMTHLTRCMTHPMSSRQLSFLLIPGPLQPLSHATLHRLVPPVLLMWWKLIDLPAAAATCASYNLQHSTNTAGEPMLCQHNRTQTGIGRLATGWQLGLGLGYFFDAKTCLLLMAGRLQRNWFMHEDGWLW